MAQQLRSASNVDGRALTQRHAVNLNYCIVIDKRHSAIADVFDTPHHRTPNRKAATSARAQNAPRPMVMILAVWSVIGLLPLLLFQVCMR